MAPYSYTFIYRGAESNPALSEIRVYRVHSRESPHIYRLAEEPCTTDTHIPVYQSAVSIF